MELRNEIVGLIDHMKAVQLKAFSQSMTEKQFRQEKDKLLGDVLTKLIEIEKAI